MRLHNKFFDLLQREIQEMKSDTEDRKFSERAIHRIQALNGAIVAIRFTVGLAQLLKGCHSQ